MGLLLEVTKNRENGSLVDEDKRTLHGDIHHTRVPKLQRLMQLCRLLA